jgi:dTMP kinase
MNRNKGRFILFEGIDGSGKSTQCEMLYRFALGKKINSIKLSEPTGGEWGIKIRKMLSMEPPPPVEEQISMFIKDRVEDVLLNINPALERGKTIIMDRYFYSNAAYQGCAEMPPEEIIKRNMALNFPLPERVYFLDLDPETAMDRIIKRSSSGKREIFEKVSFLKQVRENFLSVMDERFLILDASMDPEEIFPLIIKDFISLLKD